MELQQLLLGRDYLQRAAGYQLSRAAASVDTTSDEVVRVDSERAVESADVDVLNCRSAAQRSCSLHDVSALLRQRHRQRLPVTAMMQYPPPPPSPSQHALRTPAAVAIAGCASPPYYCGTDAYYERSSSAVSTLSSQRYLSPPSHPCFPPAPAADASRHHALMVDSLTACGGMSYDQHYTATAALLRDSAVTRLAETRCTPDSRLTAGYWTDPRRCTAAADLPAPPGPPPFSLQPPPSSHR